MFESPQENTMFTRVIEFLKESRNELSKVVFPSRREVISATIVVILSVIFVSIFLGMCDLGLSKLMARIMVG